jgi:hypothetical protein
VEKAQKQKKQPLTENISTQITKICPTLGSSYCVNRISHEKFVYGY